MSWSSRRSRSSMGSLGLLASLLWVACSVPAPEAPADEGPVDRPNILILFSDDQRADALGAWGNEHIVTPNLDALAERGFNFRRAHIMGSHHGAVCAPSRAMLMSGRTLFHVYDDLEGVPTMPEVMGQNGYVTFGTGKWHQSRESFERSFSQGRNVFFGGMSDHHQVPLQDLLPGGGFSQVRKEGFSTDLFAETAIRFLEAHAASGSEVPFLAYVAFTAPHDPRTPPREYVDLYAGKAPPLPESFAPLHPFHNGWMTGRDEQLAAWPRDPAVIREQLAEYYGLISHVDARIGDLLATLERTGQADRTIVVFTSDNGLALGSHGLLGKQSLYEHSTHVPLIFAGPGIPAGESHALAMLYDIFPTVAGLTGTSLPEGVEGLDLGPVWRQESTEVRDVIYTAYEDLHRAVSDGRYKLIRYPPRDHVQLFDLETDPHELQNRADDPAYAEHRARLESLLESEHNRLDDPHPLVTEATASMEFDHEAAEAERAPDRHQPGWVVEKYFR